MLPTDPIDSENTMTCDENVLIVKFSVAVESQPTAFVVLKV